MSEGVAGGLGQTEMTRREAKRCASVCQVEFVSLRVGGSSGRAESGQSTVRIFVCVSFVKRRAAVIEERKER